MDPAHQFVAYPLTGLGRALLVLGRPEEARVALERALAVRTASHAEPDLKAETRRALAEALRATGEPARAARLLATSPSAGAHE
jgi:hypothetical protein